MATPVVAGIAVAGTLAGSAISSRGASQAASTQAAAADRAGQLQAEAAIRAAELQQQTAREQIASQERMFERQTELQEPWRQAGISALGQIQGGAAPLPPAFTGQVNMLADPGYQFRLSEGMKALERQAAARGGLISGSALKAAQRFGQDLASQEYGAAYGRALTEYDAQRMRATEEYNRLAGQAGIGQTATGALTGAAGQMGANISNILGAAGAAGAAGIIGAGQAGAMGMTGAAQARASGYVGQANALAGGISNIGNLAMQGYMLNRLLPSAAGAGSASPFLQGGGGGF